MFTEEEKLDARLVKLIILGIIILIICGICPLTVWAYHTIIHPGHYPNWITGGLWWIIPGTSIGSWSFGGGLLRLIIPRK